MKIKVPRPPLAAGGGGRHPARRFLADEEGAERRIPKGRKDQVGFGFDRRLSENPGNAPVDIVHDEGRRAGLGVDRREQCGDIPRIAGVAFMDANAELGFKGLECGLGRVPGGDCDPAYLQRRADARNSR